MYHFLFDQRVDLDLSSVAEPLTVPGDVDERYCGNQYLLAVMDEGRLVDEMSEVNNAGSLQVLVQCQFGERLFLVIR
jgi:hypothetical protein